MWDQVQSVLGNFASMVWFFNPPKWEGASTRLQVIVGVRGYLSRGRFQDYDVVEDGSICRSTTQPEILEYATFSKIRVLAYDKAKWIIDPQVDAVKFFKRNP